MEETEGARRERAREGAHNNPKVAKFIVLCTCFCVARVFVRRFFDFSGDVRSGLIGFWGKTGQQQQRTQIGGSAFRARVVTKIEKKRYPSAAE